jgi:glycosyltransferase involved in cell wall biosynthesis
MRLPARGCADADAATRISVVIPVKDDAAALRRCLRALSLQTRTPDEIVVVDNGSADDSAEVAEEAGARVVRCDRPGIPAAAARGYDAATGELILRLDADCLPAASWVASIADRLESRPDLAAISGGARFVDGPRALRTTLAAAYLGAYALVTIPTLGHFPLFGSNLGMRAAAWRSIRDDIHLDAAMHDDLDLSFHLGARYRIGSARGASMGMSMRPFWSRSAFARRVAGGSRTVVVHWPEDFPPVRWIRLIVRRAAARLSPRTRRAVRASVRSRVS